MGEETAALVNASFLSPPDLSRERRSCFIYVHNSQILSWIATLGMTRERQVSAWVHFLSKSQYRLHEWNWPRVPWQQLGQTEFLCVVWFLFSGNKGHVDSPWCASWVSQLKGRRQSPEICRREPTSHGERDMNMTERKVETFINKT